MIPFLYVLERAFVVILAVAVLAWAVWPALTGRPLFRFRRPKDEATLKLVEARDDRETAKLERRASEARKKAERIRKGVGS